VVKAPAATCVNHRRRARVASCSSCGNALCADCVVHTAVGVKCRSCTGVKGAGATAGAHVTTSSPRADAPAGARRRPWAVPLVAGGLVLAAVAAFALVTRDSGDAPVETFEAGLAPQLTERHTNFDGPGGQTLGGTLTLPGAGDGENLPAVLIIPGLGALDRNGTTAAATPDAARDALVSTVTGIGVSAGDPLYRELSETLAKAGVASFRYERRGTTPSPLREGQKLSFEDEVADARAALELLTDRAEVATGRIGLIGHDTGAIVAMRMAAGNPRIKGVVALSLPARPLAQVIAADTTRSRGASVADQFRAAVATLTATGTSPTDGVPELFRPVFASGHDAYLSSILTLDPTAEAARVEVPVLLVRGGADTSVTQADVDRLAAALKSGSEVVVGAPNADHNLTLAGPGHEHSNTVSQPVSHRDADAATKVTDWVKSRLAV
jgi:dienelactone hydrolase